MGLTAPVKGLKVPGGHFEHFDSNKALVVPAGQSWHRPFIKALPGRHCCAAEKVESAAKASSSRRAWLDMLGLELGRQWAAA